MPPPIAGLALAQEYRHPHFELFGERDDVPAVLLDGFAVSVGARGGVADFRGAVGYDVGKSQGLVGAARDGRRRAVLLLHRGGDARRTTAAGP